MHVVLCIFKTYYVFLLLNVEDNMFKAIMYDIFVMVYVNVNCESSSFSSYFIFILFIQYN